MLIISNAFVFQSSLAGKPETEANIFNDWGLVNYNPFCNCVYGESLRWHSVFVSLVIEEMIHCL